MAREFGGARVLQTVVAAIVLTAVIPPAAATGLARWRVARAHRAVADLARVLAAEDDRIRSAGASETICGPGRLPFAAGPGVDWLQRSIYQAPGYAAGWEKDPWGRCYLFAQGRYTAGKPALVLSAGTNGEVETPLDASAPSGDDIAARVR